MSRILFADASHFALAFNLSAGLGFKEYHKAQREFGKYDPGGTCTYAYDSGVCMSESIMIVIVDDA